jgi:hypothetical protein
MSSNSGELVGIVVGGVVVIALAAIGAVLFYKLKKTREKSADTSWQQMEGRYLSVPLDTDNEGLISMKRYRGMVYNEEMYRDGRKVSLWLLNQEGIDNKLI